MQYAGQCIMNALYLQRRRIIMSMSDFVFWISRCGVCAMAYLSGFRPYTVDPGSIALCCCTNGMGHVIQMLRILDVLNAAGIRPKVIVIADLKKIPKQYVASLRSKIAADCEIFDLEHEIHYDENLGASISNLKVTIETIWKNFGIPGWTKAVPRCAMLLNLFRPEICLSLWDWHLPAFIDATDSPTKILQVATQSILYEKGRGDNFVLDLLYLHNGMRIGEMIPLSFAPNSHGMPIVCDVPPICPSESYLVAYSCMPSVLTQINMIKTHRIILFAKQVEKWKAFYCENSNIEVQRVGAAFQVALAKSSGLIASPSPGVVMQALCCAKPCYLFVPPGHLEQTANFEYYTTNFIGVASPLSESVDQWADRVSQTKDIINVNAMIQAKQQREWLQMFEGAAKRTLIPTIKRMQGNDVCLPIDDQKE